MNAIYVVICIPAWIYGWTQDDFTYPLYACGGACALATLVVVPNWPFYNRHPVARQLGLHGAKVVIMGRRQAVLEQAVNSLVADGIDAAFFAGDVRRPEDAQAAVEVAVKTFGTLNVLVNGAAGNFLSTAENLSTNAFRTVLDIDAVGTFNMSTAAFPVLKHNSGVIVNISANLHQHATWYQAHAAAAKAAVDSLTRSLALEWGRFKIRVVGVAPGPTADTPGIAKLSGGMEDLASQVVPLGRMGTKTEIGQVVVFVVSSAGAYVTGDTILADGGHYLHQDPVVPPDMVAEWDIAAAKSPTKRPQTAVGPRERLKVAAATFYRQQHATVDDLATGALSTAVPSSAAPRPCGTIQAWLTGETHLESLHRVQQILEDDTKVLSTTATADQLVLPIDFTQDDLQPLHAALKDKTGPYLRDLYQCFRSLRGHMASKSTPPIDGLFHASHRFHSQAEVLALLFEGDIPEAGQSSALSDRQLGLMLTHCDTHGNGSVDMHLFLHLVQTVSAPRETLLSHVFDVIAPTATLEKKSNYHHRNSVDGGALLRVFKLIAMVRDVQASRRTTYHLTSVLTWLQSHIKATAIYKSILDQRNNALEGEKVCSRRSKLRDILASVIEAMAKATHSLATRAATATSLALPGHVLHAASQSVLEKVAKQLQLVAFVAISPVASCLPEAFVLVGAVELDVSHVGLTALPTSLGLMVHLRTLSASQYATIVMEQWKDVETVDLAANNLVKLPDEAVRHWPKLTSLTVHDNRLVAIPDSLGSHCKALSVLRCHHNCLTSLPLMLSQLVKLTHVTWHHNKLDDLFSTPMVPSSPKMLTLHRLQSVTTFSLAHNCLRHVPTSVGLTSLRSLRVCDLSHNDLRDLASLDFSSLVSCVEVDLRRNRLTHLPPSLFCMPKLTHLSVQANVLVALPQELASAPSLETLHAHTNHIAIAIRKLVDHLQRSTTHRSKADFIAFQRSSANDRKQYSLRVRKGRGKFAAEYVDWAFREEIPCREQQLPRIVSVAEFRRVLAALGAPWTVAEWHCMLHEFQGTTIEAQGIDVERFVQAVEAVHSAKASASFAEGLFACLADKASPHPHHPHSPPPSPSPSTQLTSSPPIAKPPKQAHHPSTPVQRHKESTSDRATAVSFRVYCMTSRKSIEIPWTAQIKTTRDLKRAIHSAEGIPVGSQILIVSSGSHRVRLHDDYPLDMPTPASPRMQLLVGESVDAAVPNT
ncbi:hypothetical protein B5M09_000813 [Aphanomyces astaci]|uniref:2,4-dienoyl-CoA reductase [(3E)-enoyl-CoA-producing] n=1 Tax=Aphanomyces astaci TaxID=112090 RepID=A0A425D9R5_APHAT|nr:hypothetical protein B5M09_000813 [Aphanomyces astaci]